VNPELEEFLKTRGIELTKTQKDKLKLYRNLLYETSDRLNLLSARDRERIEPLHFADSLAPAGFIPRDAKVADWGSGAGLPGIPLAIEKPDIRMTLVESRKKKAAFLLRVIRELSLKNVEVFPDRGENLEYPFDVITVRAIGSIRDVFVEMMKHLKTGGAILFYKGPRVDEEMAEAKRMMKGFKVKKAKVILPRGEERRYLLVSK